MSWIKACHSTTAALCKSCHDVTRCSCTPSRSRSSITDQPNQINQLLLRGTQSPLSPLTGHRRCTLSCKNDVASHFLASVHYPCWFSTSSVVVMFRYKVTENRSWLCWSPGAAYCFIVRKMTFPPSNRDVHPQDMTRVPVSWPRQ